MSGPSTPILTPRTESAYPGFRPAAISTHGGRLTASVTCFRCRRSSVLSPEKYSIGPDGVVMPAFHCPHDGCGLVEFLQLEGWADIVRPVSKP